MAMTLINACSKHWVCTSSGWPKQAGMILLLSLALLAGLSLLAILAASSMLQQQQMAANHADSELARLSAITAVGLGERFVLELPESIRTSNCKSDCYAEPVNSAIFEADSLPQKPESLHDDWWINWGHTPDSPIRKTSSFGETEQLWALPGRQAPMFIIEELEFKAAEENTNEASDGLMSYEEKAEEPPDIQGVAYYRVLGRGTGIAASSTHVVESILARPWRPNTTESENVALDCSTFRPWFDCGRMAYRERR